MSNQSVIAAMAAHHEQMEQTLGARVQDVIAGARRGDAATAGTALDAWIHAELMPHALAEESTLYDAAAKLPGAALLIEAMRADHRAIEASAARLAAATEPLELVALSAALWAQFQVHLAKENDQVMPALDAAGVNLDALLEGMHTILGGGAAHGR